MLDATVSVLGEAAGVAWVHRIVALPGPAAEARALVVEHGVDDLRARVHHEGAVLRDRLADGPPLQEDQLALVIAGHKADRGVAAEVPDCLGACDRSPKGLRIAWSPTLALVVLTVAQAAVPVALNLWSQRLFDALEKRGFRLDFGEEGTGWQFKYLTRGGGYYFNVGCSDLIADGKIALAQYAELERVLPGADLVVLATGWKGQEALVGKLFGEAVAARVGPIWGFGEDQELRNMFRRTAQPGLWFIAGSFAQCRIYSKYLALQIQARELGLT